MARIRTIKPEYWSSPSTASCEDPWARLLFIAMWNWADDAGRGTANPKELAGFAFPNDEKIDSADIRRMLGEIRRAFGVVLYMVDGRPYFEIPSWDDHQKIDKRSTGKHPGPEQGHDWDPDPQGPHDQRKHHDSVNPAEDSADPAESSPSPRRDLGAGTGEQGNRGTGESAAPPPPARAGAPARGRRGGGEHVPAAELDRTAHGGRAHVLLTQWSEQNRGQLSSRRRELAREIDRLLAEGADPTLIPAALDEAHGNPRWRDPVKALRYAYSDVLRATADRPRAPVLAAVPDRVPTTTARVQGALALLDPEEP